MILSEHINYIKNVISRGPSSDDSRFSDRQIYFLLKYLRTTLLKQQIEKGARIDNANFQTICCIDLEYVADTTCGCYSPDCKILRSKVLLPKVIFVPRITQKNGYLISKVETPKGSEMLWTVPSDIKDLKYTKTKNIETWRYYFVTDRLYVFGDPRLKKVKINAIFEDPTSVYSLECGNEKKCFNPDTFEFPMSMYLVDNINKMSYQELINIMYMLPEDTSNDGADIAVSRNNKGKAK